MAIQPEVIPMRERSGRNIKGEERQSQRIRSRISELLIVYQNPDSKVRRG